MLISNIIGKIINVKGEGSILIVKASGDQVIAKVGELIAKGDTVIVTGSDFVLIDLDDSNIQGFGIIREGEVAKLDDVFFDQTASLLAESSQEDPVNIGVEPTLDIIQLINKVSTSPPL